MLLSVRKGVGAAVSVHKGVGATVSAHWVGVGLGDNIDMW